jgi:hypothetical protein
MGEWVMNNYDPILEGGHYANAEEAADAAVIVIRYLQSEVGRLTSELDDARRDGWYEGYEFGAGRPAFPPENPYYRPAEAAGGGEQ